MIQTQRLVVYGNPRGKGRPRFAYGSGHTYTDAVTTAYEGRVKREFKSENCFKFEESPITVTIKAFFAVPVSFSRKKTERLFGTPHMHKPDADNIAKICLDALNGLMYPDDRFIAKLIVEKWYCRNADEEPRVEIEVTGGKE